MAARAGCESVLRPGGSRESPVDEPGVPTPVSGVEGDERGTEVLRVGRVSRVARQV